MLVGKRQPDHFQLLLLDDFSKTARRLLLLARPEPVTFHKTQRVPLVLVLSFRGDA